MKKKTTLSPQDAQKEIDSLQIKLSRFTYSRDQISKEMQRNPQRKDLPKQHEALLNQILEIENKIRQIQLSIKLPADPQKESKKSLDENDDDDQIKLTNTTALDNSLEDKDEKKGTLPIHTVNDTDQKIIIADLNQGTSQQLFQLIGKKLNIPDFFHRFLTPFNQIINLLLPDLPRIQWRLKENPELYILELTGTSIDIHFSEEKGTYLFHFKRRNNETFKPPSLKNLKKFFDTDLKSILPEKIIEIYENFSVDGVKFYWNRSSNDYRIYLECIEENINLLGFEFKRIIIPLQLSIQNGEIYFNSTIYIQFAESEFKIPLPGSGQDWVLSFQKQWTEPKNIVEFVEPLLKDKIPSWLLKSDQFPHVDKLEGKINLNRKTGKISITNNTTPWRLLKIEEFQVQFREFKLDIEKEADRFKVRLVGKLQMGTVTLDFKYGDDSKSLSGKITRSSAEVFLNKIGETLFSTGLPSNLTRPLSSLAADLNYEIKSNHLTLMTRNQRTSLEVYKSADQKWISLFEYKKPDNDDGLSFDSLIQDCGNEELKTCLAELSRLISSTDIYIRYVSAEDKEKKYSKGFTSVIKLPIHSIPFIREIIKGQLFLPLRISREEKTSINLEPVNLVGEINLQIVKINNIIASLDSQTRSLIFNGTLDLGIGQLQGRLSASLPSRSFSGEFNLSGDIPLLGIIIKNIRAGIAMTTGASALQATLTANFIIPREEQDTKGSKEGQLKLTLSPTGGGIKSFKATFPENFTLSLAGCAELLVPVAEKDRLANVIQTLRDIFPFSIGPVEEPEFTHALQNTSNSEIKSLLALTERKLIGDIDKENLSAKFAGQMKIADIFTAFLMVEIGMRTGITLLGGIKAIDLFNGLITIRKSRHIPPPNMAAPIDISGPLVFFSIPLKNLQNSKLHLDAYVSFLGISMDCYLDISREGFLLHLNPQINWPIISYNASLDIEVSRQKFLFATETQLTFTIPACQVGPISIPEIRLLGISTSLKVSYDTSAEKPFYLKGGCSLSLLGLDVSLEFEFSLSREDCQNFQSMISAVIRELTNPAKIVEILRRLGEAILNQIVNICKKIGEKLLEAGKAIVGAIVFIGEQIGQFLEMVGQEVEKLLFPDQARERERRKRIQDRNVKLCVFRYLLRKNTPESILEAYQFVQQELYNEIENINDTLDIMQKAIVHMEQEPLVAFCYLRMLESHLILHTQKPGQLKLRALTRYLLGLLYSHERVPMSSHFRTDLDQLVEDKYQTSFYLTSPQLKENALQYFISSYNDFSMAMIFIKYVEDEKISHKRTEVFSQEEKDSKESKQQSSPSSRELKETPPQGIGEILPLHQILNYKDSTIKKSLMIQESTYEQIQFFKDPQNLYDHVGKILDRNSNRPKVFDPTEQEFETKVEDLLYRYQIETIVPKILFDLFLKNPWLIFGARSSDRLIKYFSEYQQLILVKILYKFYLLNNQSKFIHLNWVQEMKNRLEIKIQHVQSELRESKKDLHNKNKNLELEQLKRLEEKKANIQTQIQFLEGRLGEEKDTQTMSDQTILSELKELLSTAEEAALYDPLLDGNYFQQLHNLLEFFIAKLQAEIAGGMTAFYHKRGKNWTTDAEQKKQYLIETKTHLSNALMPREYKRFTRQHPSNQDEDVSDYITTYSPYHESFKLYGSLYVNHILHPVETQHSQSTVDCHSCMVLSCRNYEQYLKITFEKFGLHEDLRFFIHNESVVQLTHLQSESKVYTMDDVPLKLIRKKILDLHIQNYLKNRSASTSFTAASALFSGLNTAQMLDNAQTVFADEARIPGRTEEYKEICQLQSLALRLEVISLWVTLLGYNMQTSLLSFYQFLKRINPTSSLKIKNKLTTVHTFHILQQLISTNFNLSADEKSVTSIYRDHLILLSDIISQSGHFISEFKQTVVEFEPLSINNISRDFVWHEYEGLMFSINLFDLSASSGFLNKLWMIIFEKFSRLTEELQENYFALRHNSKVFKITFEEFKGLNSQEQKRLFSLEGDNQYQAHLDSKSAKEKRTSWLDKIPIPTKKSDPTSDQNRTDRIKENKYEEEEENELKSLPLNTISAKEKSPSFKNLIESNFSEEELLQWLIINGDINSQNNNGFTLLQMACAPKGNAQAVKLLIDNKADVNTASKHGTALHIATRLEKTETVSLLLEAKADVSIRDSKGYTAAKIASEKNNLILQGLFNSKVDQCQQAAISDSDEDSDDDQETEAAKRLSLSLNQS